MQNEKLTKIKELSLSISLCFLQLLETNCIESNTSIMYLPVADVVGSVVAVVAGNAVVVSASSQMMRMAVSILVTVYMYL